MAVELRDPILQRAKLDWAANWLKSERQGIYSGGAWQRAQGRTLETIDPATGKVLSTFVEASEKNVDDCVASARSTFATTEFRKMPRQKRAQLLCDIAGAIRNHHEELATLEALDNGKLFTEAFNDDIPEAASVFEYYAGWIDKFYSETCPVEDGFINYTVREPLGVCGLITPWNFPLLLGAWKLAPALAMGNTVVIKPSPFTTLSTLRLFEILHEECELPPGMVNLVCGGAEVGAAIASHAHINKVSFTGSTSTGKKILHGAADSNLKTVTLELGGKSPNILFDDAPDLEFAIKRSYEAMFSHKGEKCSEPTRLLVHRSLYSRVVDQLSAMAEAVVCGNQFDGKSQQGAQCNKQQFDKIMSYIESGKGAGARLVAGGTQDKQGENGKGLFVRPTIFSDVDNKMAIAQDEIFGPVLVITPFESEDEAVAIANDTIYGLAAGLWTADVSRAHRVASKLDAGMIFINRYGCYDFCSPFGGFKQSGWGKEMAVHSLDAYTRLKSVWLKI
jgi:aldehyde dehydrogenase (NAD+)